MAHARNAGVPLDHDISMTSSSWWQAPRLGCRVAANVCVNGRETWFTRSEVAVLTMKAEGIDTVVFITDGSRSASPNHRQILCRHFPVYSTVQYTRPLRTDRKLGRLPEARYLLNQNRLCFTIGHSFSLS
jgi:hypothetical protein